MKALVFALIFSFFSFIGFAQKSNKSIDLLYPDNNGVEIVPQFRGGNKAFSKYVKDNLKWPAGNKHEGRVVLTFFIEKDGRVTSAKVTRSLYPLCDAEALRVIRNSPRWIPGKALIGKKVKFIRMQLSIPINFSLDNE
jgi:protein TonB